MRRQIYLDARKEFINESKGRKYLQKKRWTLGGTLP